MARIKAFLCSVALGWFVGTLDAADWSSFRGPNGDGTSGESSVPLKWGPNANIAWKVELPSPGASSPIVVGQRVFVTSFTGKKAEEIVRHVNCFDRKTGKLRWKNSHPAPHENVGKIVSSFGSGASPILLADKV